jgi:hypothetical protein
MTGLVVVLGNVLSLGEACQVLDPVIQLVPIVVVDDEPSGQRSVHGLPNGNRTLPPSIGLGDLYPSPEIALTVTAKGHGLACERGVSCRTRCHIPGR